MHARTLWPNVIITPTHQIIIGFVILTSPYANFEARLKPFLTSMKAEGQEYSTVFSGHAHLCQDNCFAISTWNKQLLLQAKLDRALTFWKVNFV